MYSLGLDRGSVQGQEKGKPGNILRLKPLTFTPRSYGTGEGHLA
jgi:hypothetical protein